MEPQSIYQLVQDVCETYSSRPIYWVKNKENEYEGISYSDWYRNLKKLSSYLLHLGVKKADKIGLICDNRVEWSTCSLASVIIGCVDVPRGCDATEEDLVYILNHSEAKIVFVETETVLLKIKKRIQDLKFIESIILINHIDKFKSIDMIKADLKSIQIEFLEDAILIGGSKLSETEQIIHKNGNSLTGNDLATIIYTSGTTGLPKGVMLNHKNFTWSVEVLKNYTGLNFLDRTIIFLPPWHIAERLIETTMLYLGASMANTSIASLANDLKKVKPTILVTVPRLWEAFYSRIMDNVKKQPKIKQTLFGSSLKLAKFYILLKDTFFDQITTTEKSEIVNIILNRLISLFLMILFFPFYKLAFIILKPIREVFGGQLRFAFCGAGAMSEHVEIFFRAAGVSVIETYGMTETTGIGCIGSLPFPKVGAIGKPLLGLHIKLLDEKGNPVLKPGEKGIAWHKGPNVTRGYYKDEKKTKELLANDWLNSGDILTWTNSGELKFAGRAKDTIVLSGGENIEPLPIENKILESDFIQQAIIVGHDQKNLGVILVPSWELLREKMESLGVNLPVDRKEWNKNSKLKKFFKDIIKEKISTENGFKAFEKISPIHVLHKEFEKGVEMTETLKLKRNVIFEIYQETIQQMYKEDEL